MVEALSGQSGDARAALLLLAPNVRAVAEGTGGSQRWVNLSDGLLCGKRATFSLCLGDSETFEAEFWRVLKSYEELSDDACLEDKDNRDNLLEYMRFSKHQGTHFCLSSWLLGVC